MQRIETDSFEFNLRPDWTYFVDGTRLVCRGADDEELIVSVRTSKDKTGQVGHEGLDRLFQIACSAIDETVKELGLIVIQPIGAVPNAKTPCHLVLARSPDNAVFFTQVVFLGRSGVLYATLESSATGEHLNMLFEFIRSMRDRAAETAV